MTIMDESPPTPHVISRRNPIPVAGFWRSMVLDPPQKSGRYAVGHRGRIFGDAVFIAEGFNFGPAGSQQRAPSGWSQVPDFQPNLWLDTNYEMGPLNDATPRMPIPPTKKHEHVQQVVATTKTSNAVAIGFLIGVLFTLFIYWSCT